jgi:hypothetical protein
MKVLTAAQMREVDRRTSEMGIPGIVLMENAGHRVVEFLAERFAPLPAQRIVVLCGKGNNGGDGMVVARQLHTRFHPQALHVVLLAAPEDLKGDAAANYACWRPAAARSGARFRRRRAWPPWWWMRCWEPASTARPRAHAGGHPRNQRRLSAGQSGGRGYSIGDAQRFGRAGGRVRARRLHRDVHRAQTGASAAAELRPRGRAGGGPIGSPPELYEDVWLSLLEPEMFEELLAPRPRAGTREPSATCWWWRDRATKSGAAAMAGLGALRAGAGLVTVASAASAIPVIAAHAPELMTAPLETNWTTLDRGQDRDRDGAGAGRGPDIEAMVARAVESSRTRWCWTPMPGWAGHKKRWPAPRRVLTPHPGEMARLTGKTTAEIQNDRVGAARASPPTATSPWCSKASAR